MKTGIKIAVIATTILTGATVVEAQQNRAPKHPAGRQGKPAFRCPNCGWQPQGRPGQQQFRQRQGRQQPQIQGCQGQGQQQRPQYQGQRGPRQHPQYQGQQGPRQRPQLNQQQRQQVLKRFDKDGDGRLSQEERRAAKKAYLNRQKGEQKPRKDKKPETVAE